MFNIDLKKSWPCFFSTSDTTGEKDFEEFFTEAETLDFNRFQNIGIIKNDPIYNQAKLNHFENIIQSCLNQKRWNKDDIIELFNFMIPNFHHKETGKYLDGKM